MGLVVNDIGDLGVDAMILSETGWPHAAVDALNGACACCSDSTDLEEVLEGMRELKRELLLFETTGVADAADMLNQLTAHDLRRLIQTPRLISVIDVTRDPDPLLRDPIVQRQVTLADLIVLSKTDLVAPDVVLDAKRAVQAANPRVSILEQELNDAEMAALLEIGVGHEVALDEALVDGPPGHGLPHTVSIPLPRILSRDRFEALLNNLPPGIVRAKGFVSLDVQAPLHVFQYVEPAFVQIAPFKTARRPGVVMASGIADPYAVFIGATVDEPALRAALDACIAEAPRAQLGSHGLYAWCCQ